MPHSRDPLEPSADDFERAGRIGRPIGRWMARWRRIIRRRPWLNTVYKVIVTVIGVAVIIIGLILVPLPGPGWLIVFIGLTILGSEFHWARRFTGWLRMQLARFWAWWRARKARKAGEDGEGGTDVDGTGESGGAYTDSDTDPTAPERPGPQD
ncbi:TIGR02611 family protein [Leucobacter soli]|nr:TIGR02611 family protein [Leucobacter soli]